ncbi:DUF2793 domain-containing protein [Sphingomonas sp. LHG3443-2]|uniref:DUF2793 domain-containing protein n=1 Tax=Sphingomonas sp. LHG3443-2 TaxID=2804639 RepID=UPI003CF12D6E
MTKSQRLGLPFLSAGQAQKELTHNEALLLLDALVHGCCPAAPSNVPPPAPEAGLTYICGDNPVDAWAGHPHHVASYSDNGWRFTNPVEGLELLDRASGRRWHFASGTWSLGIVRASEVRVEGVKVLGTQRPPIANATGGTTIDSEARSTLAQILTALRAHGIIATMG